ncbi:hypothetical protein WG915_02760 [Corynebacterium sp. H128]|uniref:hypothetical protein n=1 Tax=Corynebacterium sp. H128 TaxID=3133427 RepID=UPI0030B5B5C8
MTARSLFARRTLAATALALSATVAGATFPALTGTSVAQAQFSLGTQTFVAGTAATVVLPESVQTVDNVTVSGLPAGMTFSGSKPYTISGTPTTPGTYTVTATGQAPVVGTVSATGVIIITEAPNPAEPTATPTAEPTPTITPTATPTTTATPEPGSSGSSDGAVAAGLGLGALALGSAALSSGGSSEPAGQAAPAPAPAPTPATAPEKGVDPNAPQKGIDPKAPKAQQPTQKAAPAKRGMLASTGVEFPVAPVVAVFALLLAAGAGLVIRRRNA